MNRVGSHEQQLAFRLQRELPLSAHCKPRLLAFLRRHLLIDQTSPRLTVMNVFHTGDGEGLMCGVIVSGGETETPRTSSCRSDNWRSIEVTQSHKK